MNGSEGLAAPTGANTTPIGALLGENALTGAAFVPVGAKTGANCVRLTSPSPASATVVASGKRLFDIVEKVKAEQMAFFEKNLKG